MADYRPQARRTARRYGIPENVFLGMIGVESSWNPRAMSPAGAAGLAQLMPGTARGLGVKDPFDAKQSLDGGARYLRAQFDRFGNWRDALRAYNQGPNAISDQNAGAEYAAKVLGAGDPKSSSTRARAKATGNGALLARPRADFLSIAFADDPEFLDLLASVHQEEPVALPGPELEEPVASRPTAYKGKKLILPTQWSPTHVTDGLGWGTKTAADIMAAAGTPVGAPEAGTILRWGTAQGGQSLWLRGKSGRLYWLGHLDNIAQPGSQVRRGQVIARVSADHPRPHVHIDAR